LVLSYVVVVLQHDQSPNEKANRGNVDPGCGARERRLKVFGQVPVAIEPSQGTFDNPAPRQYLKAPDSNALDDLGACHPLRVADFKSERRRSLADCIPEPAADFPRNMHGIATYPVSRARQEADQNTFRLITVSLAPDGIWHPCGLPHNRAPEIRSSID
jgi:hypothetical protein